jgi:hypothetical protein
MPVPVGERCRSQVAARIASATMMTAIAASVDKLATMTPMTRIATNVHRHEDPGRALLGWGSVIVPPLLSIDRSVNE